MKLGLLEKAGRGLYRLWSRQKGSRYRSRGVRQAICVLHPGSDAERLLEEYYGRKLGLMLFILLAGGFLGMLFGWQGRSSTVLQEGQVMRGEYLEVPRQLELVGEAEGFSEREYALEVSPQLMEEEQSEMMEKEFWQRLQAVALGENVDFEHVNQDLMLPEQLFGYPFLVEWNSLHPHLIDAYGAVQSAPGEEGEQAVLTARITYGSLLWEHELAVTVIPPCRTEEELYYDDLYDELFRLENTDPQEAVWHLPEEWEGRKISWKEKTENNGLLFFLLSCGTAVAIFFLMDKDLQGELDKRTDKLKEEYPVIINKLSLYVGAGMSVRSVFRKLMEENISAEHPAYQEIAYTWHELQAGMSEGEAYERYGRRSGLPEYIRLSALLTQNLKKGNRSFLVNLREESDRALQEQLNRYRQKGETASTKLLVPMVIMLGIVMVMIMLPAFGGLGT